MYQEIIDKIKPELEKSIEHLKETLAKLRTGRATPVLVEDILVNYYNSKVPLKQIATISIPDARTIVIQPWDKGIIKDIEKAISSSGAGLNPVINGTKIHINLSPLTEETRKDLVKILHKEIEKTRVNVRMIRENAWRQIKNLEKEGNISEDEKFTGKDELQKVINEFNGKIEEIGEEKEREIMTI